MLARRPIAVKAAAGAILGAAGDATAQRCENVSAYEPRRGIAFTSFNAMWSGPCCHFIFESLERAAPQARGMVSIVPKMLTTQLLVNPFIFLPLFYGWTGAVLGRTVEDTLEKARREALTTLQATWLIFAPFNVLMFTSIPVRHQPSATALVSFAHSTVVSYIAGGSRSLRSEAAAPDCPEEARDGGGNAMPPPLVKAPS